MYVWICVQYVCLYVWIGLVRVRLGIVRLPVDMEEVVGQGQADMGRSTQ